MKLFIMQFSPASRDLLCPNILLSVLLISSSMCLSKLMLKYAFISNQCIEAMALKLCSLSLHTSRELSYCETFTNINLRKVTVSWKGSSSSHNICTLSICHPQSFAVLKIFTSFNLIVLFSVFFFNSSAEQKQHCSQSVIMIYFT
jgi:hypothetical protein